MASPPPASIGTYSYLSSTATKRGPPSPDLVPSPFIKKRNLEWSLDLPAAAAAAASPRADDDDDDDDGDDAAEGQAALPPPDEAVKVDQEHVGAWTARLAAGALIPFPAGAPRLPIAAYRGLYEANAGRAAGAHFVVTQHNHPIAGTHYDLRLQINATSSASWALMYGLPGAPNGARQGRMAVETRVHCLWVRFCLFGSCSSLRVRPLPRTHPLPDSMLIVWQNHLIESASPPTGSLLIWDTGTYSILEQPGAGSGDGPAADPDSQPSVEDSPPPRPLDDEEEEARQPTEQQKLHAAFQARKIRLQLHGTRLPRRYVVNLRLTKADDAAGRDRNAAAPPSKPRRRSRGARTRSQARKPAATSSEDEADNTDDEVPADAEEKTDTATDQVRERRAIAEQDGEVRRTNEYPGARNSIGSVYQRKWFVSLDREASGFVRQRRRGRVVWEPADDGQQGVPAQNAGADEGRLTYPFFVRGPNVERSLVTGRLGAEVLRDDGVEGFVSRKGWRAVLK